ncbi:hypothetical protein QTP88_018840 [Uroleucon formosanum]
MDSVGGGGMLPRLHQNIIFYNVIPRMSCEDQGKGVTGPYLRPAQYVPIDTVVNLYYIVNVINSLSSTGIAIRKLVPPFSILLFIASKIIQKMDYILLSMDNYLTKRFYNNKYNIISQNSKLIINFLRPSGVFMLIKLDFLLVIFNNQNVSHWQYMAIVINLGNN